MFWKIENQKKRGRISVQKSQEHGKHGQFLPSGIDEQYPLRP